MKIIILKNKIVEALNLVERATGNNPHLPILKNILVRAQDNKIDISATNLEFAITYTFSGKIVENGEVTVPANLFSNLVKNLTSERVNLETKGKKLIITTDNYEAEIQIQDVSEFPIIPTISNLDCVIETSIKSFLDGLISVLPAIQYSEIRPEISGVLLFHDSDVFIVGTDSFRLAERRFLDFKKNNLNNIRVIIPIKVSEEIARIFANYEDESLSIFIDQTQILFKTKNLYIISRLIDGNFPDYKQIIPKEVKNEVVLNRQEFMQAIKLVSSFSSKIHDIIVRVGENKKYIELSSSNSSVGENIYKISAKIKGDIFSIVFNWHFLFDGLKSLHDEEIVLGVNSSEKPALIKGTIQKDYLYVVMPLKV